MCNYCNEPVLVHNEGDVVYPYPLPWSTDKRIPEDIRKNLDEAKMCFSVSAYRACAVMTRRAMQSACINKGSAKNRLIDQLQGLADNGAITRDLKEWADVVRWVGNDAAHPGKEGVSQEDAKDILNLAEQFLHVVYVAPAIAKERKKKRKYENLGKPPVCGKPSSDAYGTTQTCKTLHEILLPSLKIYRRLWL